jgi:hypothetical protein
MDVAYLSALSALAGSIVGGLTSGVGGWLNQRAQARAGRLEHEILRRERSNGWSKSSGLLRMEQTRRGGGATRSY